MTSTPSPRPRPTPLLLLCVLLLGTGLSLALAAGRTAPATALSLPAPAPTPSLPVGAGGAEPPAVAPPAAPAVDPGWLVRTSRVSGVPRRALAAYAAAQLTVAQETPGCRLTWPTLAGIGWVESRHGTLLGGVADDAGVVLPRVLGPALDGSPGRARLSDTDGGMLDGDPVHERAVGPLQFLPATWAVLGADGDGDGRPDPDDLDDAALAAGRHLCAGGADLTTAEGWSRAVHRYNHSEAYVRDVLSAADVYAARSLG